MWNQRQSNVMSARWQERAIRTAYFLRIPNVGDRVNPSVVTALTGRAVSRFAGHDEPHLLAIGSVMASATPLSQVWGTGVMHPDLGIGSVPAANVHALRGPLSHTAMRNGGVMVGDVPFGDPGYLAPSLMGIKRAVTPKYRVGLVCHYVDRLNPGFRRMMKESGVTDLNVLELPEVFLARMAECETVISSSLHGLVFAEALSIPNLWVKAGDDIAGGDFKFRDWFSTTKRPQVSHHLLSVGDTAEALAKKAECHESTIDVAALTAAFPHHRLQEMELPFGRRSMSVDDCRTHPIPVFLISFNRGGMLKRTIAAIRRLSTPTEIVIHDNGSTDPDTTAILNELEKGGIKVFRYPAIHSDTELNRVDETVQSYFSEWGEPGRYVVSDCDVDISVADPRVLDVYDELLNNFRRIECVGPMLRIRDIPRSYPLFNRAMNRHVEQFWRHLPTITETSFGEVAILPATIDTTFALHRAGESFRRLKSGLRVYEPYEALHLDWYWGETDAGASSYAHSSSPSISHWNNAQELIRYQDTVREYSSYFAVRQTAAGALEVYEEQLSSGAEAMPQAPSAADVAPIPAFSSASAVERNQRVAHTEALRAAGASDVARWGQTAYHYADWAARGTALARMVKPGERVFEFGAGRSAVPDALPPGCSYTASDVAPLTPGVVPYDLNAPTLAEIGDHDVALFSGVLEYVHDLSRAAHFLARHFASVVCSYAALADGSSVEIERRRYSGWFTDLTDAGFIALFTAAGFTLTNRANWETQILFRFDKHPPA